MTPPDADLLLPAVACCYCAGISGTLPPFVSGGFNSSLVTLNLEDCRHLSGTIPDDIAHANDLTELDLGSDDGSKHQMLISGCAFPPVRASPPPRYCR